MRAAAVVMLAMAGAGYAVPAASADDILTAPTLIAHTDEGDVGYRDVGQGSVIVLLTGTGASMDNWDPSFVNTLAARHRVIVVDNAGVGETAPLSAPLTIAKMAGQTGALLTELRLRRPAVLGWSMGGMIAQALAVLHPGQVGRLILAATQPGTGQALPIPQSVIDKLGSTDLDTVISLLFPPDRHDAGLAYIQAIFQYPDFYAAPPATKSAQLTATLNWIAGDEPAGRLLGRIHVPTLIADGTEDVFNPVANDRILACGIARSRLVLYPDAGHAFLFQEAVSFVPVVERFLGR
ncbi:MAG TPA: alpha/beta hydrolase [Streptosporangiaceae bacterium]|jgi:pimeloyl-ACP methyl ester carboxylesterase